MTPKNVVEISQFSLDIRTNVSFLHIHEMPGHSKSPIERQTLAFNPKLDN